MEELELIRSRIHEALETEQPPADLRRTVIWAVPMKRSVVRRMPKMSFQWAGGFVAALLAIAIVAALMYSHGLIGTPVTHAPKPSPARFESPEGIGVAPDGTVYVADYVTGDVFRIASDGSLVLVAGTGTRQASGRATKAELVNPSGVAFDSTGNLYVSEYAAGPVYGGQGMVRRIDPAGNLTTFAGSGDPRHPTPDGVPATSFRLMSPLGIAFDASGNLYIGDQWDFAVRFVDRQGIIHTLDVSGLPGSDSWQPGYLAFDSSGNLYVSDRKSCRIVRFTSAGKPTVIAGTGTCGFGGDGGPASAAQINDPNGIAFDSQGNLYFADSNNHRIRRIDRQGVIKTVVGTGVQGSSGDDGAASGAELAFPFGIAIGPGDLLYISDASCGCDNPTTPGRIRLVNLTSGLIITVANGATPIRTS
jgi:trimeric autotransporter adhesin